MPYGVESGRKDIEPMKLGFLYTEPDWSRFLLGRNMGTFPVPTETVVYEARMVVPLMARAFRTDLYLLNGSVVPYNQVSRRPGFRGTAYETLIVMVEVWADAGEDGHTDWEHVGWRFVPDFCLKFPGMGVLCNLPEPMQKQYWDYRD